MLAIRSTFVAVAFLSLTACGSISESTPRAMSDMSDAGLTPGLLVGQTYRITNVHSGLALDIAGSSLAEGALAVQQAPSASPSQLWTLTADANSTWQLVNVNSGKCLDVANSSRTHGSQFEQSTCKAANANQTSQQFTASASNANFTIANEWNGLLVDDSGASMLPGNPVIQWPANGGSNQTWAFAAAVAPLSYLHAAGSGLQDALGRPVVLRGVNVGGWLVTEDWMCGITDTVNDTRFARETLEARFTAAQVNLLFDAWEDNWFTTADLDAIKSYNFNLVRVPFGWRNLQNADTSWIKTADGNIDFSRFDWIVNQAEARGIYVLFDLHIWDTQQQNYSLISQYSSAAQPSQQRAAALWQAVAQHFAGRGAVAGFDVVNEPTGSPDNILQRTIYQAIRAVDANRLLILESVSPADSRMTNVMYSVHDYNCTSSDLATNQAAFAKEQPRMQAMLGWGAPLYIGEFMSNGTASWDWLLQQYNGLGVSWSPWTYKTVNMGGWGLVDLNSSIHVNLQTDSYDSILKVWSGVQSTSSTSDQSTDQINSLKAAAAAP